MRISQHVRQTLRIEDVLLIYSEHIVRFRAIIYSNTNSVQLFCENSSVALAQNWQCFVLIHPKTFYTSATCDKFHA